MKCEGSGLGCSENLGLFVNGCVGCELKNWKFPLKAVLCRNKCNVVRLRRARCKFRYFKDWAATLNSLYKTQFPRLQTVHSITYQVGLL